MAESGHESRQRFWARVRIGALLPYAIAALLLIGLIAVFGREIGQHVNALEVWIAGLGRWGVLAYVGLFVVLSSLLMPDTVLGIIAGAVFGVVDGSIAVVTGTLIAASLQRFLSQKILHERIQRLLSTRPSLLAIQRAVIHQQLRLQVLLRLTPLNPAAVSYALGAAGVSFGGFLLACLALIPALVVEVYFGHVGKHLATVAGGSRHTDLLHDALIVAGLIFCLIALTVVSRTARRAVEQAVAEASDHPQTPDA